MSHHIIYLSKSRTSKTQRFHFGILIPNDIGDNQRDLTQSFREQACKGTIIHVIGEPLMNGYTLEFKCNYDCSTALDLQQLVRLENIDANHVFVPSDPDFRLESVPRSVLEREATTVIPPEGGQDLRAPIDGVKTKRCQEWTMDYLRRLVEKALLSSQAVDVGEQERDSPTFGIFGLKVEEG